MPEMNTQSVNINRSLAVLLSQAEQSSQLQLSETTFIEW